MNRAALIHAIFIGTVLQAAMVVIGHFQLPVRDFYALGGMGFSLVAGVLYVRAARSGWSDSLIGGVIAGAVCAFLGIAISWALKDVPVTLLALGTASSAVTGLIGAAIARGLTRPVIAHG
ncbi:MAG: hypothetical protein QE280_07145 [Caulobacter sp.]|nr:hypothetical protein [Caulobacter sp.]